MPDSSDEETRRSDRPPPAPAAGDTLDAPAPPEAGTLSALTHSASDAEPLTATLLRPGARAGEPFPDPPGFAIVREVGSGGMGVVYEARQAQLNRAVALKVLKGERGDTNAVIRFLAEAQAVAAITHPHVVQVYGSGQAPAGPYMVLELLTGGTLSDKLRGGRMAPRAAAELLVKLAGAVQAAHDLGIVHRDLKPGNVLFDADGEPKVTDFGLAKKTGGADLTHTNALMGTPAYMAPEQARGETKFVGPAADVWALGAILYECLTGKRAFDADDTWGLLRKVTNEAPPAPRAQVPDLPRDLELIALKCLEKRPADRYPSAAALAADLESYLAGRPVSVRPAGPVERLTKWAKRNPAVAALTAGVALALVIGSAVSLAFGLQAQRRGEQLAGANADLTRSNDDLARAAGELKRTVTAVNDARNGLVQYAADLSSANDAAAERGYLSDVALAHQLWKANDLRGMRAALSRCPTERRRWEWHHLDRLSRPEMDVTATAAVPLALAYSRDGKSLAYLTLDGALTVRDTATGAVRHQFAYARPDSGIRLHLAFRPDHKELAFAVGDRYWALDLTTWKATEFPVLNAARRDHTLVAVGYSADGRVLVGATTPPTVRKDRPAPQGRTFVILDPRADKVLATLDATNDREGTLVTTLSRAAFSPDGARFAASTVDTGVRVGPRPGGDAAAFDPFRPDLRVWDVASGKELRRGETGADLLGEVTFGPDGNEVACGGQCWPCVPTKGDAPARLPVTGGAARGVAVGRDGLVWFGGEDKTLRAWDRATGAERAALRGCPNGVLRLAASPDGKELAVAVGDIMNGGGAVVRFDLTARAADEWHAPGGRDRVGFVAGLSPDGTRFAASHGNLSEANSGVFQVRTLGGTVHATHKTPETWLRAAFGPDGSLVALAGNDTVRVLEPDGKLGRELKVERKTRRGPTIPLIGRSPDGRTAVVIEGSSLPGHEHVPAGSRFGSWVRSWDAGTGAPGKELVAGFNDPFPADAEFGSLIPAAVAFDPARDRLAVAFVALWQSANRGRLEARGVAVVWNRATGEEVFRQITLDPTRAVAFAPDGTLITAGGGAAGGGVFGWNVDDGTRTFALFGHARPVLALAVGPNGRIATGSADRTVKVWDLAARRELLTFDEFAREVTHLTFTADGKTLVAGTGFDQLTATTMAGVLAEFQPAEVRAFRGPR